MINLYKNIKMVSIIMPIIYILLGIILIIAPELTVLVICYILGGILLLLATYKIIGFFVYNLGSYVMLNGMIDLGLGLVLICCADYFSSALFLGLSFGIVFIIKSLIDLQNSLYYRQLGAEFWWIDTIFSLVLFISGILLIINPFATTPILFTFLGIVAILNGIMSLISTLIICKDITITKRNINDMFSKNIIEGKVVKEEKTKTDENQ